MMLIIEIIAVVFSLLCVILTVKQSVWCWPIGILAASAYAIIFFANKLNADFGLQFVFIVQSLIGWRYWYVGTKDSTLQVTNIGMSSAIRLFATCLVVYWVLAIFLWRFTNSSAIWVDTLVSVMSVGATWLLVKKKIEAWFIWAVIDIIYIGLFTHKGLYLSAGLYAIFWGLSIKGYLSWKKVLNKNTNDDKQTENIAGDYW